ncbi:MAG: hypothetical protein V3T97_03015, partial [Gemmatimonadota bacterium]
MNEERPDQNLIPVAEAEPDVTDAEHDVTDAEHDVTDAEPDVTDAEPDSLTTDIGRTALEDERLSPLLEDGEYSQEEYEEMLAMYEETMSEIAEGEIVQAT